MAKKTGISIVICCYNASLRICPTLQHLQKQQFSSYIPWEVILIDNASTDNTSIIANDEWNKNPVTSFCIYKENKPGLNNARAKGSKEAQYEIVSFVDDDNWLERHWVEKVYSIFNRHENVGACAGQNIPTFDKEPPAWFPLFLHSYASGKSHFNEGIVSQTTFGNLWGAGLSIRKEILSHLDEVQFNFITTDRKGDSLSCGGDTELCYAVRLLGYDLYYTNSLILKHYIPASRLNWNYLKRLNYEFGKLHAKAQPYFSLHERKPMKSWVIYFRSSIYQFLKYRIQSFFISKQSLKWEYEIKAVWWSGKMNQLWKDKATEAKKNYNYLKIKFQQAVTIPRSEKVY